MNTRIFAVSLLCVGLLSACTVPDLSGLRPEIAGPLREARERDALGEYRLAIQAVQRAQTVPNQSDKEKGVVAEVRAIVVRNRGGTQNGFAGPGDWTPQYEPPPTNGQPPPTASP